MKKVICIDNKNYKSSLKLDKSYNVLQEFDNFYRIIDESGDDYLYSKSYFISEKSLNMIDKSIKNLKKSYEKIF